MAAARTPRTLAELIRQLYGVASFTRVNRSTDNVDIALTNVLRQTPGRLAAVVVNLSVGTVYISPDKLTSSTHGILLEANGGFLVLDFRSDLDLVGYEWNAVGSADNLAVFISETLIYDRGETPDTGGAAP